MSRFIRQNRTGLIWAGIILLLTGLPGNYFPHVVTFWDWLAPDKLMHIGMFGTLSFLMMLDRKAQYQAGSKRLVIVLVLIFGTFYGALTEVLQRYIFVGRHGSILDFFANLLGILAGIAIFAVSMRKKTDKDIDL